ncbi:ABC transporter permease [Streptococcus halichoeri]|uniref:ABC transporter permease n=1 Tax=Streptococcus halichoeri TaxID=254785 RepID=UPI00135B9B22|nr:ABC transporter permease [Streptococcus halichoeri]
MIRWSIIWELIKINILYSNPSALHSLRRKQEKKPKENFHAYASMLRGQAFLSLSFLLVYIYMFMGVNFKHYPGYFSFYLALFFVMATVSCFTAMYSVFYDSRDIKGYVPLPIRPVEIYLAKVVASLGMGTLFLMPLFPLFIIAYWQMLAGPLAIFLALMMFAIILGSSLVLSLILTALVGHIIVRSRHRKLIATALIFFSSLGAFGLLLYLNIVNTQRMAVGVQLSDQPLVPYFAGFYHVVQAPLSQASLLHFWAPLALTFALAAYLYWKVIPNYYNEALYQQKQSAKKPSKSNWQTITNKDHLAMVWFKHHVATVQDPTLLSQTFLLPLFMLVSLFMPLFMNARTIGHFITADYFGAAALAGITVGGITTLPTTFVGVGISLEKENFNYIKSLPVSMKSFLQGKFFSLLLLQIGVPVLLFLILEVSLFHFNAPIFLSFMLAYLLSSALMGQIFYRRDYKNLNLNWQNVTELFTQQGNQWLFMGIMLGAVLIGGGLLGGVVMLSIVTQQTLLINSLTILLMLGIAIAVQLFLHHKFWKQLAQGLDSEAH